MEGQHFLSLKFQNKISVLFGSLNQLCFSENLCDVKFIGKDGGEVLMHKLVLIKAYPCFKDILQPQSDQSVIFVPDTSGDIIEACREDLYKSGDANTLGLILGFGNVMNLTKIEEKYDKFERDAIKMHNQNAIQEYVAMDVVHDYVDIDTLQEMTGTYRQTDSLDHSHSHQNKTEKTQENKQKKSSFSELTDVPYYFLKTSKSHNRKNSRKSSFGSQGMLVTHDSYKFNKNNVSRDYLIEWWQCREKIGPLKCRATASTQSLDGKTYFLRTCSKPEDHMHMPDKLSIYKDRLVEDIKTITRNLPTTAVGKSNYEKAKNMAVVEASKTYLSDPDILEKVVASIQDPNFKLNKKLTAFKQHVVSKINKELSDSGFSFNQT